MGVVNQVGRGNLLQDIRDLALEAANGTVSNSDRTKNQTEINELLAEVVNFTKQQILLQASTAMLAQANIQPQSLLLLFKF